MGTLTKRIHRHERYWVRMPPKSAPAAPPPPAATAPHTPRALARARLIGEGHGQDGQRGRGQDGGAHSLQRARAAMSVTWFWAKPPIRLAPVKRTRPNRKIRRRPRRSAKPAAEEQESAKGERVGGDHPLEVGFAEAEVLLDGRERHIDDGDVEHHHELGQADDGEYDPVGLVQVGLHERAPDGLGVVWGGAVLAAVTTDGCGAVEWSGCAPGSSQAQGRSPGSGIPWGSVGARSGSVAGGTRPVDGRAGGRRCYRDSQASGRW